MQSIAQTNPPDQCEGNAPVGEQLFHAADTWDGAKRELRGDEGSGKKKAALRDAESLLSKVVTYCRRERARKAQP